MYDAWNSPEVLSIVSKIAGVELVPQFDLEIAHTNLSSTTGDPDEKAHRDADEGISGCPVEDDTPIVDWHTDSYAFVCVIMLSDCTNMVGGETALRKGDGSIMKVRGPGMVGISFPFIRDLANKGRDTLLLCKGDTLNTKR